MGRRHVRSIVGMVVLAGATLAADTLVLRNGDRVQGRLVSVRDGVLEFEEERGGRNRVVRLDLDDVRSIELDRGRYTFGDRDTGRDGGRDRDGRAGTGAGFERPRGLRERELSVASHVAWTDAGIDVRAGQVVYFDATGRVRWGPRRQDGPEGEDDSPRNPARPIPGRPAAALIGRIGQDAPFFIGDDREGIRMPSSGRLSLGINDDVLTDNSGEFRVTVSF
jgi:hypothetical protein